MSVGERNAFSRIFWSFIAGRPGMCSAAAAASASPKRPRPSPSAITKRNGRRRPWSGTAPAARRSCCTCSAEGPGSTRAAALRRERMSSSRPASFMISTFFHAGARRQAQLVVRARAAMGALHPAHARTSTTMSAGQRTTSGASSDDARTLTGLSAANDLTAVAAATSAGPRLLRDHASKVASERQVAHDRARQNDLPIASQP